jgi:bifunctional DNA-binding transcriptional regulator/antitoxin component of YhaV-PrlF toxin-antitoxin module
MEIVKCWQTRKGGAVVIVLPKKIRDELKINPQDLFIISPDKNGNLILKKVKDQ